MSKTYVDGCLNGYWFGVASEEECIEELRDKVEEQRLYIEVQRGVLEEKEAVLAEAMILRDMVLEDKSPPALRIQARKI